MLCVHLCSCVCVSMYFVRDVCVCVHSFTCFCQRRKQTKWRGNRSLPPGAFHSHHSNRLLPPSVHTCLLCLLVLYRFFPLFLPRSVASPPSPTSARVLHPSWFDAFYFPKYPLCVSFIIWCRSPVYVYQATHLPQLPACLCFFFFPRSPSPCTSSGCLTLWLWHQRSGETQMNIKSYVSGWQCRTDT